MSGIVGIGVDVVDLARFERALDRTPRLRERLFTAEERVLPLRSLAGRWAAKEAVLKALGTGWRRGISWRDVEVRNGPGGRPQAFLKGGTQEVAEKLGIRCVLVSISHCRSHATAYAVALDEVPETFSQNPLGM